MNKQDKNFFCALVFAHTGVLAGLIMFSPYYWHKKAGEWEKIRAMGQTVQFLKGKTNQMEAEVKVQRIKKGYEKKGIGVEEAFNLRGK